MDLFTHKASEYFKKNAPLAERMRPKALKDFIGQEHLFLPGTPINLFLQGKNRSSIIFWGPPGTGKTTLVNILANESKSILISLSAVTSGKKDLTQAEAEAIENIKMYNKHTIVFVDEIHRFNKLQQDGLLHTVEKGTYTLIGATTENPSFEVITPLLSRCQIVILETLNKDSITKIIMRALKDNENGIGKAGMDIDDNALNEIVRISKGDGRTSLNILELSALACSERYQTFDKNLQRLILPEDVSRGIDKRMILYDKTGDEHYNTISAFIKSVRGSDPQGAVYYLARMLEGGEDPVFIARRLCILASEDIGNAEPMASILASSIFQNVKLIGMPESRILLSQLTVFLSLAPKSNAAYMAIDNAIAEVKKSGNLLIPKKILNAPTPLMKDIGYGSGYNYAHDFENSFSPENYLPDEIQELEFYFPTSNGYEKKLKQRLEHLKKLIAQNKKA